MSVLKKDCKTVRIIWADEAAGREPDSDERSLVERHVTQCESCRMEAEAIEAFRVGGRDLIAPPLDDLAARRWIDQTLERADNMQRAVGSRRSLARPRVWVPAAAAAALIASLAIVVTSVDRGAPAAEDLSVVATSPAPGGSSRVLLVSGEARVGSADAELESRIDDNEWIEVGEGRMAVELAEDVDVVLGGGTRARIERTDSGGIQLRLERGRVVARIDPARRGPPFSVTTARGRVMVTGTVLSVRAEERGVEVAVYRGSVRIEERAAEPRVLKVGESTKLGSGTRTQIEQADRELAETMLTTLELVSAPEAATVAIDSVPSGATVTVGDLDLGSTPLTVALRPGYRKVRLHKTGRESVQELINLEPGTEMTRVFELAESVPEDPELEEDTVARADRAPRADTSSPGELLFRAQALRRAGRWQAAVNAYDELIRRHPRSAEAGSSRVSKGSILLERLGQPADALESFKSYLKGSRNGTLAQEAAFGRISALRALGRSGAERKALTRFLGEFPDAIQTSRAQRRLAEIEATDEETAGSAP